MKLVEVQLEPIVRCNENRDIEASGDLSKNKGCEKKQFDCLREDEKIVYTRGSTETGGVAVTAAVPLTAAKSSAAREILIQIGLHKRLSGMRFSVPGRWESWFLGDPTEELLAEYWDGLFYGREISKLCNSHFLCFSQGSSLSQNNAIIFPALSFSGEPLVYAVLNTGSDWIDGDLSDFYSTLYKAAGGLEDLAVQGLGTASAIDSSGAACVLDWGEVSRLEGNFRLFHFTNQEYSSSWWMNTAFGITHRHVRHFLSSLPITESGTYGYLPPVFFDEDSGDVYSWTREEGFYRIRKNVRSFHILSAYEALEFFTTLYFTSDGFLEADRQPYADYTGHVEPVSDEFSAEVLTFLRSLNPREVLRVESEYSDTPIAEGTLYSCRVHVCILSSSRVEFHTGLFQRLRDYSGNLIYDWTFVDHERNLSAPSLGMEYTPQPTFWKKWENGLVFQLNNFTTIKSTGQLWRSRAFPKPEDLEIIEDPSVLREDSLYSDFLTDDVGGFAYVSDEYIFNRKMYTTREFLTLARN